MNTAFPNCFALDIWSKRCPNKIAIQTESGCITYAELHERSSRLAGVLSGQGLRRQDPLLLFMPNCIEYAVAFFAGLKLGANIIPANALCKNSELSQILQNTRPKYAVVSEESKGELLRLLDDSLPVFHLFPEISLPDEPTFSTFPEELSKPCVLVSTSGSTGKLKFVMNSYQNEILNAKLYLGRLGVTERDILLTELPASQKFGMAALLGSCIAGATLIMPTHFNAAGALELIQRCRVTVQYGVPTMYIREMEAYEAASPKPDLSSLRAGIIAGASGASDVFRWFDEHAGCRLLNCYGTSEIGGLTMVRYEDDDRIRYSSCGRAFDDAQLQIVDSEGRSLPPNTCGEVVCTVPWVMRGYASEPELTAQSFDPQGRFLTGDIGQLDEEGNLKICGRKKDLIIRGGYNVFPAEVELALLAHPDIAETCVIGYEDPVLGERIGAAVKLKQGCVTSQEEIRAQLKQSIAKFKLPDRILFLEDIPRLPNGKYHRTLLAKRIAELS